MLNKLLKDEEFGKIFFAELLNQNGAETGIDTERMFKEWARENSNSTLDGVELERFKQNLVKEMHSSPDENLVVLGDVLDKENGDDDMEDIPISIRELEEKGKEPTEKLAEPEYYAGNGLSPLEAFKKGLLSREETIGFIKGNVIKYTVRAGHKENASTDIVKAIDYLGHLKRLYESDAYYIDKVAERMVIKAFEGLNEIEDKQ
ncbi:DUF3310 domain-containing protein [uncultured Methanobrevibacter sp.]|uniref:DUF3310 domain-containing protein n=1 Tax=uncultured Methanobrevibacter sp. TaxID=253161 RepID=UPI0025D49155|nr:DUF3310 domain-containing protein [uncultured Methanobrevibacter sp.]